MKFHHYITGVEGSWPPTFFLERFFFINDYVLVNLAPPKSKNLTRRSHIYFIFMSLKICVASPYFLYRRGSCYETPVTKANFWDFLKKDRGTVFLVTP